MGGVLAHEIARQLETRTIDVVQVTMIDSWGGICAQRGQALLQGSDLIANFSKDFLHRTPLPEGFNTIAQLPAAQQILIATKLLNTINTSAEQLTQEEFTHLMHEHQANYNALINHQSGAGRDRLHEFRATKTQAFPLLEPFCTQHLAISSTNLMNEVGALIGYFRAPRYSLMPMATPSNNAAQRHKWGYFLSACPGCTNKNPG